MVLLKFFSSHELRDISAEEMINDLRGVIRQKDNEINTLHSENCTVVYRITKNQDNRAAYEGWI